MVDGINWAVSNGADIINLSLGGAGSSTAAQNAVNSAHANGVLVIAAMGNCRVTNQACDVANPTTYPAAYDNVMAVAATGPSDVYASYSQYGSHCDIAAPGGDMGFYHNPDGIYSTMPTYDVHLTTQYNYYKNYDYLNGTSQATPHVAGLAALILSVDSTLTPDEIQTLIEQNAVDLGPSGWDADYGHGRIDIATTLQAVDVLDAPALAAISNPDEDGQYLLDWTAVPEATTYTLQEDDNASFTSPQTVYSGSSDQYNVTNQIPGVWYYRVQAANAGSSSLWSNVRSTTVLPDAPTLDTINNPSDEDAYTLSWSAVTGATSYTLQEAPTVDFLPISTITRYVGANIQYDVTGQRDGTWHYRVRAAASTGDGPWSNIESTDVATSTLNAPLLDAINNSDEDGAYEINWNSVSGATSYTLEESADRYFTSSTEIYSGSATQFNVTNQDGGTWHYRVRAHNATDSSPWSITRIAKVVYYVHLPLVMRNYISESPLQNGDFEDGTTNWTEYSSNGFDLIIDSGFPGSVTPHSGQWAVWLGGYDDETSYIEQAVTIESQTPYLTYWHWIASEDVCGYDYGYVIVNGVVVDQYALCESESTGGWVQHSANLSTYTGQTVILKIQSVNDSSMNSNLLIDDVAFSSSTAASVQQQSSAQIDADAAELKP
jgi:hypothetical protein